jgi:hypothetical protein
VVAITRVPNHASAAPAGAGQTFVALSNRLGAVIGHGVRARRAIAVLGNGLTYLVAIGSRLSRSIVGEQQCNSNRNKDPRHVDFFLSVGKSLKGR